MDKRLVRAELFHDGGQTDEQTGMTALTVPFRNFPNAPKNKETHT